MKCVSVGSPDITMLGHMALRAGLAVVLEENDRMINTKNNIREGDRREKKKNNIRNT